MAALKPQVQAIQADQNLRALFADLRPLAIQHEQLVPAEREKPSCALQRAS